MLSELTSITTLLEFSEWPTIIGGKLTTCILLAFFVILAVLESNVPKRKLPSKGLRRSYRANISLFIFNSAVLSIVSASPLLMLAEYDSAQNCSAMSQARYGEPFCRFCCSIYCYMSGTKPVTILIFYGCFIKCITTILV